MSAVRKPVIRHRMRGALINTADTAVRRYVNSYKFSFIFAYEKSLSFYKDVAAMKLLYITTARIPTEKAHGVQIMKMCEAFQRHGLDVTLMVPTRRQTPPMRKVQNVWDFYEIATRFSITYLLTPDLLGLEAYLPARLIAILYGLQCLWFACWATLRTLFTPEAVYYSRSLEVIFLLTWTKWLHRKPIYFEAHELHGDPRRAC